MSLDAELLLLSPPDLARLMNEVETGAAGFTASTGIVFEAVAADEVVGTLEITPGHLQAMGIVHGGVWATMVETLASAGAALGASRGGGTAVGVENATSFLRSVSSGRIRGVAKALHRDESTHVWVVELSDEAGRLVAHGNVRLAVLRERRPKS